MRGRKPIKINLPSGEFTIKDVVAINQHISKISIQNRIKQLTEYGELAKVGKQQSTGGRQAIIYKKN